MSKKIIAILLCLVMAISLCGCSGTTYTFEGVSGGPTTASSVENNNTNIVFVDGYAYYVNNSVPYYYTNTLGVTTLGTINRMDLSTGEIVVVQSKLVADQNGVGIFIYGDKIYYTSPSDEKDRDGSTQYTYLDIMVCDLNGANPEKLYTFGSAVSMSFVEENGIVYAVYEDNYEIKSIDLSASTPKSTVIATDYYSGVSSTEGIFILRTVGWYEDLYSVSPTGEETLILSGKTSDTEKHSISILSVKNGKIYYTLTDSVVKQNAVTYVANLDGSNQERITALTVSSSIYEYGDGYIFQSNGVVYYSANGEFTVLDDSSATSIVVGDGYLFTYAFSDGVAQLYKTDIDAKIADSSVESVLMFEDADDYMYESTWASLTIHDGVGYYFSDNSYEKDVYAFDVDGTTSYSIAE